jgi:hypothetical protein
MKIVLDINPEFFAFAEAMAKHEGYFGPADYLNAILNMAIITEMDEAPPLSPRDEEPLIVEDAGGGLRIVDDIDDDIPF